MGYRIVYPGWKERSYSVSPVKKRFRMLFVVGAAALLILVNVVDSISILPGNSYITGQALESMAKNLQAGDKFSDAFRAFCVYIISNG